LETPKFQVTKKPGLQFFVDDWRGFSASTLKGWLFWNSVEVDSPIKYVLFTVCNFGMKALVNGRKMSVGEMNDIKKYERLNRISTRYCQKIPFKLPVFSIYVVSICILSGEHIETSTSQPQKTPQLFRFHENFGGDFSTLPKSQRGMSGLVYFPVAISCATATV